MNAPVFTLPTSGPATYRGKYPARVRSVSYSRDSGLHVELNDGTRLWTARPDNVPTAAADCADMLARAVPMTAEQYERLREAAALLRTRAGIAGHGRRAELEARVRAMLESIQPETEAKPEAETAKPVRRDNVEYHAGKAAHAEGKAESDCPYMAGGDRAARWSLGFREAADAARGVVNITPAWAGMGRTFRALAENGDAEGKRTAWAEIGRALVMADERNAMAAALQALAIVANETAEHIGKPGTMARDEMDSALAAAFALLNAPRAESDV